MKEYSPLFRSPEFVFQIQIYTVHRMPLFFDVDAPFCRVEHQFILSRNERDQRRKIRIQHNKLTMIHI